MNENIRSYFLGRSTEGAC